MSSRVVHQPVGIVYYITAPSFLFIRNSNLGSEIPTINYPSALPIPSEYLRSPTLSDPILWSTLATSSNPWWSITPSKLHIIILAWFICSPELVKNGWPLNLICQHWSSFHFSSWIPPGHDCYYQLPFDPSERTATTVLNASVTVSLGESMILTLSDSLNVIEKKYRWSGGPDLKNKESLSHCFFVKSAEMWICHPIAAKAWRIWIISLRQGIASAPEPYPYISYIT